LIQSDERWQTKFAPDFDRWIIEIGHRVEYDKVNSQNYAKAKIRPDLNKDKDTHKTSDEYVP
jgi:hypothetical protein